MSTRPPLTQFGDLRREHFAAHPAWVACHSADYDEPWYAETDEETFRPVAGGAAADPAAVFPARVCTRDGACVTVVDASIEGFYQLTRLGAPPVIHR